MNKSSKGTTSILTKLLRKEPMQNENITIPVKKLLMSPEEFKNYTSQIRALNADEVQKCLNNFTARFPDVEIHLDPKELMEYDCSKDAAVVNINKIANLMNVLISDRLASIVEDQNKIV